MRVLVVVLFFLSFSASAQTKKLMGVLSYSTQTADGKGTQFELYEVYGTYGSDDRYKELREKIGARYGGQEGWFEGERTCMQYQEALMRNFKKKETKNWRFKCMPPLNEDGTALNATDSKRGAALGILLIHYGNKSANIVSRTLVYEVDGETIADPAALAAVIARRSPDEFVGYEWLKGWSCTGNMPELKKRLKLGYINCLGVDAAARE